MKEQGNNRLFEGGGAPLSVEECRRLLAWKDASDKEIEEFLGSLRAYLSRFLDEYFREEFSID